MSDVYEPVPLENVFFNFVEKLVDLGNGLVGVRLCIIEDEGLRRVFKGITPLARAMDMNADCGADLRAIHVRNNPLRLVK